jgi:hypothetical protein
MSNFQLYHGESKLHFNEMMMMMMMSSDKFDLAPVGSNQRLLLIFVALPLSSTNEQDQRLVISPE